jgi:transposase
MSRRRKDPLRVLSDVERQELTRLSRSPAASAVRVARAVMLLAVADGSDYQDAARSAGRKSGDAVSHLVARFNRAGLAALDPRHGGGHKPTYDAVAQARILREAARTPTPEADGTTTWSLAILRRVLRTAADGLPKVSTFTIWQVLHGAGYTFQRTRTWCPTGHAVRRRKAGRVAVTGPDAGAKKSWSRTPTGSAPASGWRCGVPTRPGRSRPPPGRAGAGGRPGDRPGSRTSTSGTARPRCSPCSGRPTGGCGWPG